jgi:hypothetical protein
MAGCGVVAGLENMLEKAPVCVCGCVVDVAPSEGKGDADAGFAPPRAPPKRLPPKPPVLAGCDVPDGALEVPPPRLPNKLGVVPGVVLVAPPKSGLAAAGPADAPLETGCAPPRLPNSDMVDVVRMRRVDCAENNHRVHETMGWGRGAWTTTHPCSSGTYATMTIIKKHEVGCQALLRWHKSYTVKLV